MVKRRQCAKCPWRTDVDPFDIPDGYCPTKGNNIALRMQAMDGRFKDWKLADVEQHERFEDTLPKDCE